MVVANIKCVLVGDDGVGKTSLIATYANDKFPKEPIVEIFTNKSKTIMVGDEPHTFNIHDTEGGAYYDNIRQLVYPDSDVVLICYSCVDPNSFENVTEKWFPEVKHHLPDTPVFLVGTQYDLTKDDEVIKKLEKKRQGCITPSLGEKMGIQLGIKSFQVSSLTGYKLKNVFDEVIPTVLEPPRSGNKRMAESCIIS